MRQYKRINIKILMNLYYKEIIFDYQNTNVELLCVLSLK